VKLDIVQNILRGQLEIGRLHMVLRSWWQQGSFDNSIPAGPWRWTVAQPPELKRWTYISSNQYNIRIL